MMTPAQRHLMATPLDQVDDNARRACFPIQMDTMASLHVNDSGAVLVGTTNGRTAVAWFGIDGKSGYQISQPKYTPPPTRWRRFINWVTS